MRKSEERESEWVELVRERYEPDPDVEMSYEDENNLLWLLNAPEQYDIETEMMEYAKKHPDATLKELVEYFDKIVPPGLAPGDDGADLLDDE